jgi:nitroreductase
MTTSPQLSSLLQARYGADAPSLTGATDDPALALLLSHRSIRAYTPQPVPQQALDLMIAAAQSASTSSNLQTWSVVAVEDQETKNRLALIAGDQRHIRECPLYLVWLADLARLEAMGEQRDLPRGALDYLELLMVGVIDAALASQNAAVAAEAQGMGVVYIGGMRNKPEEVAAELGLPPRTVAVFGMCVGYPDAARPATIKPRLPIEAVLHRERYDTAAQGAPVDRYVDTMADFYASQKMKTNGNWAEHSLNRVKSAEALRGRDRLIEALKAMGFLDAESVG